MKNNFEQLEQLVIKWAAEKGIYAKSDVYKQFEKLEEEVDELRKALEAKKLGLQSFINAKNKRVDVQEELKDSIGDCTVVLTNIAKMINSSMVDCYQGAYDTISKRSGEMKNGKFVKSEDLENG